MFLDIHFFIQSIFFVFSGKNINENNGNSEVNNDNNDDDKEKNISEENNQKEITFFIKPYISFNLSEQSKTYFLSYIDRSSASAKCSELISYSDYFIFEMMYNSQYIGKSPKLKKLSNIFFYLIQKIHYIFILLENILLLMNRYYRAHTLQDDKYVIIDKSILYKKL